MLFRMKKKTIRRTKKGGSGKYTIRDLENTDRTGKYVLNKEETTQEKPVILTDIITMKKIKKDKAILIDGHVYNVDSIFRWIVLENHKEDPFRANLSAIDIRNINNKFKQEFGEHEYIRLLQEAENKRRSANQTGINNMIRTFNNSPRSSDEDLLNRMRISRAQVRAPRQIMQSRISLSPPRPNERTSSNGNIGGKRKPSVKSKKTQKVSI